MPKSKNIKQSRRDFLVTAGAAIASTALAGSAVAQVVSTPTKLKGGNFKLTPNHKLKSPFSHETVTIQDFGSDLPPNTIAQDLNTIIERITLDIDTHNYGAEEVMLGLDEIGSSILNFEDYILNFTGNGNCDGKGSPCGTNCGKNCGDSCGSDCKGSGGDKGNCYPNSLEGNAFLYNFYEYMDGFDPYMYVIVERYKATIMMKVLTNVVR